MNDICEMSLGRIKIESASKRGYDTFFEYHGYHTQSHPATSFYHHTLNQRLEMTFNQTAHKSTDAQCNPQYRCNKLA